MADFIYTHPSFSTLTTTAPLPNPHTPYSTYSSPYPYSTSHLNNHSSILKPIPFTFTFRPTKTLMATQTPFQHHHPQLCVLTMATHHIHPTHIHHIRLLLIHMVTQRQSTTSLYRYISNYRVS